MASPDYDKVVQRIQRVYSSCSSSERQMLEQILSELAVNGYSYTYEQIYLSDFKEVPVSIDQFLDDSRYLGQTNNNGKNVYPFWRKTFNEIFSQGNRYYEILFSGSTRIGKSSSAVTLMAYMLYRLMLYRDPHGYFLKKPVSKFTLGFANLTKELALSVAYREFNDTLKESPWFMDHGTVTRSDRNFYYLPEGDKIEIIPASDGSQLLGKQLWCCLTGESLILTSDGPKRIDECVDTPQIIFEYGDDNVIEAPAYVVQTKFVTYTVRVELENGAIIEGTPDHKVMLSDGTYKELQYLSSSDDLLTFNIDEEVDEMNLKDKSVKFLVYEHVSPDNKRYIGITSKKPQERWQSNGNGYKENAHFWSAIQKYGWDNFQHNVIATDLTLDAACTMEVNLIAQYDTMNPEKGYNHTTGGNWSTPDAATRRKLSESIKRSQAEHPEIRHKISAALKGHFVSDETRKKISMANTGKKQSAEFCAKQRRRKASPETLAKLRGHSSWCKGLTKDTDDRLKKISEYMKNRPMLPEWRAKLSAVRKAQYQNGYSPVWINNGEIETSIQKGDPLPEGFVFGRLSVLDTYIHCGQESKKINHADLLQYLSEGWEKGRPASISESIRKSLQVMHWEYAGIRFETAKELAKYLRNNGYPRIVDSTITSLYKKGFDKSPTYKSLYGKVKCIRHEDKIDSSS